jgi:hypothetical protein
VKTECVVVVALAAGTGETLIDEILCVAQKLVGFSQIFPAFGLSKKLPHTDLSRYMYSAHFA